MDPPHDLSSQPNDILTRVVSASFLALSISSTRNVNDVNEGVSMAKVVKKLVAETTTKMGAWDETSNVEEFDGDGALAGGAGTVGGSTLGLFVEASTGARNTKIADGALRIYGGEGKVAYF